MDTQNRFGSRTPRRKLNGEQKSHFTFEGFGAKLKHHYSGRPNGWGSFVVLLQVALLAILIYLLLR